MISAEALTALAGLEHGARYNTMHSIARELMRAGLACNDWGYLGLTEAGRIYLRRGRVNIEISGDDSVHDMSVHMMQIPNANIDRTPNDWWKNRAAAVDPMASPQHVPQDITPDVDEAGCVVIEVAPEAPPTPTPLPIAENRMQEMLRAAGVASGKTGVWVEAAWLSEFVRALDEGGVFSEAKNEDENTP